MKKNIIFLLLLFSACVNHEETNCNDDCTPRELSTPFYTVPMSSKPDLLNVTIVELKKILVESNIVKNNEIDSIDESNIYVKQYVDNGEYSRIEVNLSQNNSMLKSVGYIYLSCSKIREKDYEDIEKISYFILKEKINLKKIFNFNVGGNEIITNQLKYKNNYILEVSCDPLNNIGQFHIYRE